MHFHLIPFPFLIKVLDFLAVLPSIAFLLPHLYQTVLINNGHHHRCLNDRCRSFVITALVTWPLVLYYPVRLLIIEKIACLDYVVTPFNSPWLHSDTFKWPSLENPHFPEGLKTTGAWLKQNYLLFRPNYLLTFNLQSVPNSFFFRVIGECEEGLLKRNTSEIWRNQNKNKKEPKHTSKWKAWDAEDRTELDQSLSKSITKFIMDFFYV